MVEKASRSLGSTTAYNHPTPLHAQWIPAHRLESTSNQDLTDAAAAAVGTTVRRLIYNRRADAEAKRQALLASPVHPEIQRVLPAAVALHQELLTKLHCQLDTTGVCNHAAFKDQNRTTSQGSDELAFDKAPTFFPKWPWGALVECYPWKPKLPTNVAAPKRWRHSEDNLTCICNYLRKLQWKVHHAESSAFCEFAIAFYTAGEKLDHHANLTMHDVFTQIRQCLQWLAKDPTCQPFPGEMQPGFAKSAGKVFCQGAIVGASFYMSDQSLFTLASALKAGAGRTTESWKVAFPTFAS